MALPLGIVGMSMQTPENMSVFRYNPYPFFTFARCSMSRGHCLNGEKRVVLVLKESEAMILSRVAKVAVVIALLSSLSGCWMFFRRVAAVAGMVAVAVARMAVLVEVPAVAVHVSRD